MERVREIAQLDSSWKSFTFLKFPQDNDLTKRMNVPAFFQNERNSVAIISANGIDNLVERGWTALLQFRKENGMLPEAFGFVLDADNEELNLRNEKLQRKIAEFNNKEVLYPSSFPSLGTVAFNGNSRFGIFIMPDCTNEGTLETLLLKCAAINYPNLKVEAEAYVNRILNTPALSAENETNEISTKSAGKNKAIVSGIGAILKPSKSIQVSIHDNKWITLPLLQTGCLKQIADFLTELLG